MRNRKTALFVHDHIFHVDEDNRYYSGGGLPAKVWGRYLEHFDSIEVVGRIGRTLEAHENFSFALSSTPRVDFALAPTISGLKSGVMNRAAARSLIRERLKRCSHLISRLGSELGLLAIQEAKSLGIPYAIELVDSAWDGLWNYGSIAGKLYAPIFDFRVRKAVAQSQFTLYVTEHYLQLNYPSKLGALTVACSNVELPSLDPTVRASRERRLISLSERRLRFGLVGSLNGRLKGIQVALQALSQLKPELPDFEFRILGGGDATPWIRMAKELGLSDRVFFDGTVSSGDPVFNWLDQVDVYIHPSLKEGLPRALLEAMSRGCPAIASDIAGTPELLPAQYIVKAGDPHQLKSAIFELASNRELMVAASAVNFSRAENYQSALLDKRRSIFWREFSKI